MICPQCGNTITMQEYKCGKCGLDLHCSTPEGRQKAEDYANQMYASGRWKMRQPVQRITDIPEKKEKKRNIFKITTVALGITTLFFAIMFGISVRQGLSDNAELVALRSGISTLQSQVASGVGDVADHNIESAYKEYSRSIDCDVRGLTNCLNIITAFTQEDLSDIAGTIESLSESQRASLDEVYTSNASMNDKLSALIALDGVWEEAVDKMYTGMTEDIFK